MATAKIEWRPYPAQLQDLKTPQRMIRLLRDFITKPTGDGGGGWTLLADTTDDVTTPYFVVTYDRGTGNPGDNPIVKVLCNATGAPPSLEVRCYESWSGSTGVNEATIGANRQVFFSTTQNSDVWLSVTPEYILMAGTFVNGSSNGMCSVTGVCCIERLTSDDRDQGTFFGMFDQNTWGTSRQFFVPKRWDGQITSSAWFMATTKLAYTDNRGMVGSDETGKHVIFDIGVHKNDFGKLKGKLYGVGTSTYGLDLTPGMLLPNSSAPEWLVTKTTSDPNFSLLMAVSSPIQVMA